MPVDIPGRADVRVSQPVADFLKLEALGEQQGWRRSGADRGTGYPADCDA